MLSYKNWGGALLLEQTRSDSYTVCIKIHKQPPFLHDQ